MLCFQLQPGGKEEKQNLIKGFVCIFRNYLGIGGADGRLQGERSEGSCVTLALYSNRETPGKKHSCLGIKEKNAVPEPCVNLCGTSYVAGLRSEGRLTPV